MNNFDNSDQENEIVDVNNENNFAIDCLYQDVYYVLTKELDITCSITDFNEIINFDSFREELIKVIDKHGTHPKHTVPTVLGLVLPAVKTSAPVLSPAGVGSSMYNISRALFPQSSAAADTFASFFGMDLESTVESLADEIGAKMKDTFNPNPGDNIFSGKGRGGGNGRTNDQGELEINATPDSPYLHHEPTKNTLVFNLGIESTTQYEEPFWKSSSERVCFVGKTNTIQFPNDDVQLKAYYEMLVPVLRNSIQANKRYTADVSTFFTFEIYKKYINQAIEAISLYYFFANGYAYCNQPGLVNNNEALRYLRQNLFQTAQLQRFQQLGQMIDSLPLPQSLINSVAQYHGWYSNSKESGATLFCNVPHGIFLNNDLNDPLANEQCSIDKIKPNLIEDMITKLTGPIVSSMTNPQKATDKFLGLLLNTIPGFRNSSIGGSAFDTDLYDEAHWNEFMNSPVVSSVVLYEGSSYTHVMKETYPKWISDVDTHRYHTVGADTPGYLQAYWTPIVWNTEKTPTQLDHHGIIKTAPLSIKWAMSEPNPSLNYKCSCSTYSNVIVWVNGLSLKNTDGTTSTSGFTLYPSKQTENFGSNIASPFTWYFDQGFRSQTAYSNVLASGHAFPQQPYGSSNVSNMSLNQNFPNRLLAIQKMFDIQDFYNIDSPTANREKKPSGRRGRKSGSSSKSSDSESSIDSEVSASS